MHQRIVAKVVSSRVPSPEPLGVEEDPDPLSRSPSSFLREAAAGLVDPTSGYRFVVAARPIDEGEVVAVFGGTIITRSQMEARGPDAYSRCLQVEEDLFLYSTVDGPADWINHSCAPNLELRGQIVLVARRRIEPGEELCFDYATADGTPFDEFPCRCGATQCRGRVSGADWATAAGQMAPSSLSPYLWMRFRARGS